MILNFVDITFLVFAFVTLYLALVFMVLYFEDKKLPKIIGKEIFPSVSILIPAFNEQSTIVDTINAIKKLKYPNLKQIIVIDDGSIDATGKLAKATGVKVLYKKNQGQKSYPLNFALPHVTSELVACVDADSYPEPSSLEKAVQFFSDPKVASVTCSVFVKNPKKILERLQNIEYVLIVWARKLLEVIDSIYVTPGALSIYRTDVLKKIGGFDNNNITEDIEIAWRILHNGYKIKMSLDSVVHTGTPRGFKAWWEQRIRWSIGGIQTTLKYLPIMLQDGSFIKFVAIFFTLTYFFSVVGFAIFAYIMSQKIYEALYYMTIAFVSNTSSIPKNILDPILLPNTFMIFGTIILFVSLFWIALSYKKTDRHLKSLGELFDLMIYLTLYITVFPVILLQGTIRLMRKKIKW
jgi:poly-beta-1,6-N-acetyl-D-glucosamine synthase